MNIISRQLVQIAKQLMAGPQQESELQKLNIFGLSCNNNNGVITISCIIPTNVMTIQKNPKSFGSFEQMKATIDELKNKMLTDANATNLKSITPPKSIKLKDGQFAIGMYEAYQFTCKEVITLQKYCNFKHIFYTSPEQADI